MHKIQAKKFTMKDFSTEHLVGVIYDDVFNIVGPKETLEHTINTLNCARDSYLKTKDKKYWWQMIQLLPSSYNQKRTVAMNYEVLANIYKSRKGHKLDEWSKGFIEWIESLPYAKELIIGEKDG